MRTITRESEAATRTPVTPPEERKFKPVRAWALFGAGFLVFQTYVIVSWIMSGPERTPTGPTPLPSWQRTVININLYVGFVLFAIFLYWFLIRPLYRERRLTTDAMFAIVFLLIWWQDPLENWFQNWASYNSAFYNLGSWSDQIPGFIAPNRSKFAEPLFWVIPLYLYWGLGGLVLGCWVMKKTKERWPTMGRFGVLSVCYGVVFLFDLVTESIWLRQGLYVLGGVRGLTLFEGKYYQFPIFEAIFVAAMMTAWAYCRFYRDDKGLTIAEKGIDEVRIGGRRKTTMRFLAIYGFFNIAFIVCYDLPMSMMGIYANAWPKDIVEKSYLMDGLCGPGTNFACSGPDVPIPRGENGAHFGPNGEPVIPEGANVTGVRDRH